MFHKQFRVKSNTAIKGSDRKKVRSEFSRQYPGITDVQLAAIFSSKEDMTVMKICTHSKEDMIVYMIQKNPVLFNVNNILYPTVYFLWKFPDVIPTLTTWPEVFKKLVDGADLMLPGVIAGGPPGPSALGDFAQNQGCAVNLHGNRAAVAVGRTTLSSTEMYEAGMKGKGVIILHTYGDHLWATGDKSELPVIADTRTCNVASNESPASSTEFIGKKLADIHAIDEVDSFAGKQTLGMDDELKRFQDACIEDVPDCGGYTGAACVVGKETAAMEHLGNNGHDDQDGACCHGNDAPQESMDDLLYQCFMSALKTTAKRIELPVLTSAFFRNFMVPCCRAGCSLDVKKSSYKKLSKFLVAMEQRGLIKVKELSKGVESICDVNRDLDEFKFFRIPEWVPAAPTPSEASKAPSGETPFSYDPPTVTEMFQVTTAVLPLFKDRKKGDAMTAPDVRQYITEYVKSCNLQDQTNKSLVTMDATLSDALVARSEYIELMHWEDVVDRCLKKMTACHQVTFPGCQPVVRKGHLEPIQLDVVQRGSNKKLTSVFNLDEFGIDPEQFASIVQKGVACSTNVSPRVDKPKSMQVLVQGNQINYIGQLLRDRYRLPSKFIRGLEKAPKKKN